MTRVAIVFHGHICTKENNSSKGKTSALLSVVVELDCSEGHKNLLDQSIEEKSFHCVSVYIHQ